MENKLIIGSNGFVAAIDIKSGETLKLNLTLK